MKNKVIAFVLLAMGFSADSFAQSEATATATATLITPITITKSADLNFGTIAASATEGTVVLLPGGTLSNTGGATFSGTATAASFTVTGEGIRTFSITLPTSITLTSGQNQLTVNNFTSTPSGTGTLTTGTATVNVGATLNVPADAPAGTYTNTTELTVTVNYN